MATDVNEFIDIQISTLPWEQVAVDAFVCPTNSEGVMTHFPANKIRDLAGREIEDMVKEGRPYSLVVVGTKALNYFRFRQYEVAAAFSGVTDQPTYDQAKEIAAAFRERYEQGELASVDLIYTRFLSAGSQEAVIRRFLPLQVEEAGGGGEATADLEYEPSPTVILNTLLPRYVESRIYSALLDASASEHAARQRAMKAATDNAEELKLTLTRVMNRARQDAITTEIMEIVGGAEALKSDKTDKHEILPGVLAPEHLFAQQLDPRDPIRPLH